MNRNLLLQTVFFFLYLLFQVLILKNIVLFHTGFILFYIGFLLFLPVETNPIALMGIGFLLGVLVDVFYDSLGVHAAATVATAYVRNYWIAALTPQGGYDAGSVPGLSSQGAQWFLVYMLPLIFVHQLALFFLEAGGFGMPGFSLLKVAFSVVLTFVAFVLAEIVFSRRGRG